MNTDAILTHPLPKLGFSSRELWLRRFMIRLRSWEYWPVYIFNIPVVGIWLYNAVRAKNLFYFTMTNPGIETGGFFGESKSGIMQHIPAAYKPITVLIKATSTGEEIEKSFSASGLSFPVMVKPEVGERGWLAKRVNSMPELKAYLEEHPIDMLLQTYIDLPLEVSIMVYTMPGKNTPVVTSICEKHFLQIEGDGDSTIGDLIIRQDRALLQLEKLLNNFGHRWDEVLAEKEILILESVGNHCRGTTFVDRNDMIDENLAVVMGQLLSTMPEVFYGRFDMRAGSWQELKEGKNIRVLEFNGTSSDPAHIYQPGYSLWKAYGDMAHHWRVMRKIAIENRERGCRSLTFREIIAALVLYFRYKRTN